MGVVVTRRVWFGSNIVAVSGVSRTLKKIRFSSLPVTRLKSISMLEIGSLDFSNRSSKSTYCPFTTVGSIVKVYSLNDDGISLYE